LLYSDGITDQHNPHGEEYGRARLVDLLQSVYGKTAQEAANAIFAGLDEFTQDAPAFDDQTLLVLKVK